MATRELRPVLPAPVIQDKLELQQFLESQTCNDIVNFILKLNESVKGKTLSSATTPSSQTVDSILSLLERLEKMISEIPPLPNISRFGNKAFYTYYDRIQENLTEFMNKVLPEDLQNITNSVVVEGSTEPQQISLQQEIGQYFLNSFGNRQRIDYGSGHELNFVLWLYCLDKLGVIPAECHTALVTKVFARYLTLMRALQKTYWLEPAGSHGVWGLDDYQFLPFLWGSSQLIDHKYIRPKSICNKETVNAFANDYMYLGCIQFILQVKTAGSFFEHSPLLFDISGAKSWEKVNEGMIKMFRAEVLSKLPIMKHFMFGSLIPFQVDLKRKEEQQKAQPVAEDTHEHHHKHSGGAHKKPHAHKDACCDEDEEAHRYRLQSCCVQRIPSAIAAKEDSSRKVL
mmetsp:Transcript_29703/g.41805  ORF Transcript_29703/g.41805 Transcript_29703/m.41805 type:complete len:399 (-) Transcript_29703:50-1246(-)